jgi:hypothetical protein
VSRQAFSRAGLAVGVRRGSDVRAASWVYVHMTEEYAQTGVRAGSGTEPNKLLTLTLTGPANGRLPIPAQPELR